ncbi:MAG: siderophore-interacting protein [Caulobacteraceae bacterium]|nr:siderophore-interacting protein [Caulobacteraceae bacterium]
MNETSLRRVRPGLAFGFDLASLARRRGRSWDLTVVEAAQVTPRMRSVSFTGADLAELDWRPGQDLVLSLPQADGGVARRHYTIRDFNPAALRLDIDFVLHGDAPGGRWALGAQPGQTIGAEGPRGRTRITEDADWRLFLGDETALPAIFAMAEALPAGARARALIEVDGPQDVQPLACAADVEVEWLFRRAPAGPNDRLLMALAALAPDPMGAHAYVLGETSNVRAQRHHLLGLGFGRDQITAEGYWRPGRVGGHDHV